MKCIVIMAVLVMGAMALPPLPHSANKLREGYRSEAFVNFVKKLDRSKRQIFGFNNGPEYDDYPSFGRPFGHRQFGLGNPYQGGLGFDRDESYSDAHSYNIGVNLPFGSIGLSASDAHAHSDHFGLHGKK
ncbi:uncharacterized protein LOC107264141 [Cephus cinctus]|uniref:Uncharacterized protein LOC107264141 n=1 Tax=Cephus cinctus TaxID=211228 RepID=A0AAJ7BJE5_CEPCN|nr:uncharacterized protein LOC107264141 [Cephus cinctus]